jgi:hypothetical protein
VLKEQIQEPKVHKEHKVEEEQQELKEVQQEPKVLKVHKVVEVQQVLKVL